MSECAASVAAILLSSGPLNGCGWEMADATELSLDAALRLGLLRLALERVRQGRIGAASALRDADATELSSGPPCGRLCCVRAANGSPIAA